MKKQGILNRELAGIFAKLGHTDQIVIADCGLPIPEDVICIDLSLKIGEPTFLTVLEIIMEDLAVEKAIYANEIIDANPIIHNQLTKQFSQVEQVSHEQFKEMTNQAKVIIRTGEATPYANVILQSGVIF
jgi:D-ribose pyranase